MNEKIKERLGILIVMGMFLFVGMAVNANIHDTLTGSNYAHWFNVIGFCLVPIVGIVCYVAYKKMMKNPGELV